MAATISDTDTSNLRQDARQAFEGSQAQPERPTKRDEEFWYNDGNVILVARDVEFRVYMGILADHSPVFKDMFSLPQPPDPVAASPVDHTPSNDQCPVVHLSDSPEDLRHVLRVYMPKSGSSDFFPVTPQYSFNTISATIRLGHKYQMSDMVERALSFLKTHYPYDYTKWTSQKCYGPRWFKPEQTVGVVNLARLTDEPTLLLMALFSLACGWGSDSSDPGPIICGFEREDGSRERLSEEDTRLVFAAHMCLVQESIALCLQILRLELSERCATRPECERVLKGGLRYITREIMILAHPDPFLQTCDELGFAPGELCEPCRAMTQEREDSGKKAVWEALPNAEGAAAGQT